MRHQQSGYVTLLSVLILSAMTTAIAITLLTTGVDSQRSTIVSQASAQARKLADACGEEALQRIRDTPVFTGTGSVTLGQGSCTFAVTSTGIDTKTILSTGTVGAISRKLDIRVKINLLSINITSWQEVGN